MSSKSSACDWAPLARLASSALVRIPRPSTVAWGSPPAERITAPSASASGAAAPRIAVPIQSVIDHCAAVATSAGNPSISSPITNSTSESITGVRPPFIPLSSDSGQALTFSQAPRGGCRDVTNVKA